ncbi:MULTISPECIES: hypothetical protein [unclassified Blastococcus]
MAKSTRSSIQTAQQPASPPSQPSPTQSGWILVAIVAILASLMAVTLWITRDVNQATQMVAPMAVILVLLGIGRSTRH